MSTHEIGDALRAARATRPMSDAQRAHIRRQEQGTNLRRVVERTQMTNYTLDHLDCGHDVADYDNRRPTRRRCAECAPTTSEERVMAEKKRKVAAPQKKQWTWDDHPVYGRGRNVIKDEARSLSYGDVTVISSAARHDPVNPEAYALIPKMCRVLNDHWREDRP